MHRILIGLSVFFAIIGSLHGQNIATTEKFDLNTLLKNKQVIPDDKRLVVRLDEISPGKCDDGYFFVSGSNEMLVQVVLMLKEPRYKFESVLLGLRENGIKTGCKRKFSATNHLYRISSERLSLALSTITPTLQGGKEPDLDNLSIVVRLYEMDGFTDHDLLGEWSQPLDILLKELMPKGDPLHITTSVPSDSKIDAHVSLSLWIEDQSDPQIKEQPVEAEITAVSPANE